MVYTTRQEFGKRFAKNLKHMMYEQQITYEELANRVQTTTVSIYRYVNNQRIPNLYMAAKLANALGVNVEDLIGE